MGLPARPVVLTSLHFLPNQPQVLDNMARPITESQNPLTFNLDMVDPLGFARLLRQSDAQLFSGYEAWPSVMDEEMLEALAKTAWRISRLITDPDNVIFLTGAGTSGRFAHLLCLEFNRVLRENRLPEVFVPLMAGGEAALIQAQEAAEDSTSAAVREMNDLIPADVKRGLYIGITAGVSAPYVAAQLDAIGGNEKFHSVLLGFNPAVQARNAPIEGWDKSVKDVIDRALESDRFIMLNPVYGPEPVTGSTRMKGGSMTKIALETAFAVALDIVKNEAGDEAQRWPLDDDNLLPLRAMLLRDLRRVRNTVESAYTNLPALAELIRLAGTALRSGGRIIYIGRGISAYLGIIDASECPPTFGAGYNDVRGYILEGWEYLGYSTASMRARGKAYEISHEYFEQQVLPEISKGDIVIGIATGMLGENTRRLLAEANQMKATTALLLLTPDLGNATNLPETLRHHCVIEIPEMGFIPGMNHEAELALKLCLNAITTGAHIMAGKVYTNVMIDLRISNSKLYDRATRLVAQLVGVSEDEARRALYRAVFRKVPTDQDMATVTPSMFVQRAAPRTKIVPLAILLAAGSLSLEEAEDRLASEPRVRRIIGEVVEKRNGVAVAGT
jgi:N-acetylmuramic acid 6-phosphate (MurNAc-6-P) etherase